MYEELSPWAADCFLLELIARLKRAVEVEKGSFFGRDNKERAYFLKKLSQIPTARVQTNLTASDGPRIFLKPDQLMSSLVKTTLSSPG